ncbi:MAG: cellulase family glycosylhydrolase [Candidatus Margulisbacteria bacterium]|nr:cellulase family glycosylhydrolase [Candidatus Margulisiibacteriota bacterium]
MSAMIRLITLSGIFVIGAFMIGCGTVSNQTLNSVILPVGLLRVEGNTIKDSLNQTIHLKGFCLTNGVYTNLSVSSIDPKFKLTAPEYQEIKSSGANVVRFYLQYHWLDDTEAFFAYMDEQLALIAATNLKVILSLHYFGINESGGFYKGSVSQPDINALKEFWKKISNKYIANDVIAGYDLLNEPSCSTTFTETTLYSHYENIIEELRNSGDEHIIFISDPVNKFDNSSDGHFLAEAFKKVTDNNVVYQFHWYKPVEFTHQSVWYEEYFHLGATYPYPYYFNSSQESLGGIYQTPAVEYTNNAFVTGDTGWVNLYEDTINRPKPATNFRILVAANNANNEIWIDNIKLYKRPISSPENITEIDVPNGSFKYADKYTNVDPNNPTTPTMPANWSAFSSQPNTGLIMNYKQLSSLNGQLYIDGRNASYSGECFISWKSIGKITGFSFTIEPNYEYKLTAQIQNNGISGVSCGFEYDNEQPLIYNKQKMNELISQHYVDWANTKGVPLYCGEWGVADPSQGLGDSYPNAPEQQVAWINDMASILRTKGLHWTYHDYKNYDNLGFGAFDTNAKNEIKQALQRAFQ